MFPYIFQSQSTSKKTNGSKINTWKIRVKTTPSISNLDNFHAVGSCPVLRISEYCLIHRLKKLNSRQPNESDEEDDNKTQTLNGNQKVSLHLARGPQNHNLNTEKLSFRETIGQFLDMDVCFYSSHFNQHLPTYCLISNSNHHVSLSEFFSYLPKYHTKKTKKCNNSGLQLWPCMCL